MEKARNISPVFEKKESRLALINESSGKERWKDFNKQAALLSPEKFNEKYNVNWKYINSPEFRQRIENLPFDKQVIRTVISRVKWMLHNKNGCNGEQLFVLNSSTGEEVAKITNQHFAAAVQQTPTFVDKVKNAYRDGINLLFIHNHPAGRPPSNVDINGLFDYPETLGLTVGHTGSLYLYSGPKNKIPNLDYQVASMHYSNYNENEKQELALRKLKDNFDFVLKKF